MDIDEQWDLFKESALNLRAMSFPSLNQKHVTGEGNERNPIAMLIGEAPGAQEEIKGRPFVGKSGLVLRDLMKIAGLWLDNAECAPLDLANAWLTNVVKFRPPGNRTPTEPEIRAFRRLLKTEWRLIGRPSLIIPIGAVALRAITGRWVSITRASGKCQTVTGSQGTLMHVWPMLHPAYGLRNPALRPVMERDWQRLAKWRQDLKR